MKTKHIFFIPLIILFYNCNNDGNDTILYPKNVELTYSSQNDFQSWEGDFADYSVVDVGIYELEYEFSTLPEPLNTNKVALKQSGNNHSDDLFMFIRKQINELEPNTNYTISFELEFASNVADNMVGVGGSPGEDVTIKVGATNIKPEKIVDTYNDALAYIMNIDKGNQSIGGSDMVVIGDFSNDTDLNEYKLKTIVTNETLTVSTNNQGELWVIIGTDSGYEATTTIYYNLIKVTLEKQ
jgi:hypothetical protein